MVTPAMRCPHCGGPLAPGTRYCPACGEVVDPALVLELHNLYATLRMLDQWIQDAKGSHTVIEMRTDVMKRYLEIRTPPAPSPEHGLSAPAIPSIHTTIPQSVPTPSGMSASQAGMSAPTENEPATGTVGALAPIEPAPAGPVFAWRAFIADQAIAIMAYLGGFLLLVATLSFEVGGWQVLSNGLKLLAVGIVYVVFGGLGLAFRRATRLGTVGRAYLAIFALMTPLVALAVYRFELQQSGFPPFGMLSLSAAYAAVVYLLLAWRTRFATYAYLGWTALAVAGLAIVPWVSAPLEWEIFTLAVVALLPLAVVVARNQAWATTLWEPAEHLSMAASAAAALGTVMLGFTVWEDSASVALQSQMPSTTAYALAAFTLAPLTAGWSRVARGHGLTRGGPLDMLDWLVGLSAAQATIGIAAALGANTQAMVYLLAVLALGELSGALLMARANRERSNLRYLLEGTALALALVSVLLVWSDMSSNWPLVAALAAGTVVALAIAVAERQPALLAVAGGSLSLAYHALLMALLPQTPGRLALLDPNRMMPTYFAALALAEWIVAAMLAARRGMARYAGAVFLVTLANALYVTALLPAHSQAYATVLLAAFAMLALAAGRVLDQPVVAALATAFFGFLAVLPYTLFETNGIVIALTALAPAIAALGLRWWLGRRWTYGPYVVALWAALLAYIQLLQPDVSTAGWTLVGIPYVAWVMFVVAALVSAAVLWENNPWAMGGAAVLALMGFDAVHDVAALTALVFVLAGVGLAWRELRGRWWSVAWYAAAVIGSPLAVWRLGQTAPNGAGWQVLVLLAYGGCAYMLAARERQALLTVVASIYAVVALTLLPGPRNLVPTLILTFAVAGAGMVVRQGIGRSWAMAFYAVAVVGSLFALARIVPYDVSTAEALLLVFAAIAYLAASLEREPVAGVAPMLYASSVVIARPDAHALLPLALVFGGLALAVSRAASVRWSWPLYVAAAVAGGTAAALGVADSGFDAWALLALALLTYAIAAVESRADVLPLALILGGLALASCVGARGWTEWQAILAFTLLAWVYFGLRVIWRHIPWLTVRGHAGWASRSPQWSDPRLAGLRVHGWGGLALAVGTALAAVLWPGAFEVRAVPTVAAVAALLSCATMLAAQAQIERRRVLWYAAGELAALAMTWQIRWLGAHNIQAFVLIPGSYQILVGALLPADEPMGRPRRAGQVFSLCGSLLLLIPTLSQSFLVDPGWVYAMLLALEALLIVGIGAGTHSRLLVLTGSVFVGAAALRGAVLAVSSDVPVALVIAILALLLMGTATWLSLRARREASEASS